MEINAVQKILEEEGQPTFRMDQIVSAVFGQLVSGWNEVMTLPGALRERLISEVPFSSLEPCGKSASAKGDTVKFTFRLHDGKIIETVLMRHEDGRRTACVSSQVGCAMACTFCATGDMGLFRNLTTEEIIDQVLHIARILAPKGERVSNVVMMGMGEPMHNYDNVLSALRVLNGSKTLNIGARRMTISTCGIVPSIDRLAKEPMQINLAVSLHAPVDDVRSRLMPVNKVYPLDQLMPTIRSYIQKTNRKVFFEYLLIDGMNDSSETAEDLADLMNHPLYHVNLIKYHSTGAFTTSPRAKRDAFKAVLEERGISVTHRISFGEDIMAACGQLAGKK